MRLVLIRHGQTSSNVLGLLDTEPPGPGLTELGISQAEAVPDQVAAEPIEAIYASTATRAQLTAAPLAASRGLDISVRAGLREIPAGDWEMLGDDDSVRGYLGLIGGWMAGRLDDRAPGPRGQTGREVLQRFDDVVTEVAGTGVAGAALVAHGAVNRFWASLRAHNLDDEFGATHALRNTGIVVLSGDPAQGWTAHSWTGADIGASGQARQPGTPDDDPFDDEIPVPRPTVTGDVHGRCTSDITHLGYPDPMTGPAVDPKNLRVSDDERSHVLVLLEKATGRGLIDLAEYTSRSATVIGATTRADLNSVLVDLPGLRITGRTVDAAAQATRATGRPTPGYSGAPAHAVGSTVLELTGWGSRSFRGHWLAPAHIVIGGFGASTKLDFTQATLISTSVTVEFQSNFGGSTELVLPRGGSVRFDGLSMRGGSVNNKIPPGGGGVLDLLLTGTKKGGSVSIRHPRQGLFGR